MDVDMINQEFLFRKNAWHDLLEEGGPIGVAASTLRSLSIYGGAQGIWVDKARTGKLDKNGFGVTVSLTHSGKSYPDDWSDEGVIYHYPVTNRPPGRDLSEVEATKNAGKFGIPVLVITHTSHSQRNVFVGWVSDWDDDAKQFLIFFDKDGLVGAQPAERLLKETNDEEPFTILNQEEQTRRTVIGRPNQQRFKFKVLKRYGARCIVCGLTVPALLQAAHIVPKEHHGTDDPRNGLVLCANHHLAFDTDLFAIEPVSLEIRYSKHGPGINDLQITSNHLRGIVNPPHKSALQWRYNQWIKHYKEKE